MKERIPQALQKIARHTGEFAERHETLLFTADTLGLSFVISRINRLAGIDYLAPVVISEIVLIAVLGSICTTAIHFREKPSVVIKDVAKYTFNTLTRSR